MITVNEILGDNEVYARELVKLMENNTKQFSFDSLIEANGEKISIIMAEINNKLIRGESISLEINSRLDLTKRKNILTDKFYFYASLEDLSVQVNSHTPIKLVSKENIRLNFELALDDESEDLEFLALIGSDFFKSFSEQSTALIEREFLSLIPNGAE